MTTYQQAIDALNARYADLSPRAKLTSGGRVPHFMDNVLPGVRQEDFETELKQGDGHELEDHFLAVHSSSALCVNAFAPFKTCPQLLALAGETGIPPFIFERKCPVGLNGRSNHHPPNLDLLAEDPSRIIAVESKCTEYLKPPKADFAAAYKQDIRDARREGPWFREMLECMEGPRTFRHLNVAQLIKHAFGIANIDRLEGFGPRAAKLVYLYWEPTNATDIDECLAHRSEVDKFSRRIAGGFPGFVAMTYRELWDRWDKLTEPDWLRAHVSNLRARYEVSI